MEKYTRNSFLIICIAFLSIASSCEEKEITYTGIKGIYSCVEVSSHSGYRNYIVEIDKVNNQDGLYIILNFHNAGTNEFIYAEYRNDSIFVNDQVIGTFFVSGSGKVYSDFRQIEMSYQTDDGVVELDYQAVFER